MKALEWRGDSVRFIDQTKLPLEESYITTDDDQVIADAIRTLKIRGAPLIGIAAAYGAALAAKKISGTDLPDFRGHVQKAIVALSSTRPTAVNLFWSLHRMSRIVEGSSSVPDAQKRLIDEAVAIHREDEVMCRQIGEHGARLIPKGATILTHCNTGCLATGGEGTAQNVIATAHRLGKSIKVYADETRPLLQGARLTMWELSRLGIDATLITDSTAAFLMKQKKIDLVVVGADRIAANGDAANKIGTYNLAVLARHHEIPFYIAAPGSTIDSALRSGQDIPIEERNGKEVTEILGKEIAPRGIKVYAPAFDITPASLITAIISERGVHHPPFQFGEKSGKQN